MRVLRIDGKSPFHQLIGVGGLGTGIFFRLDGEQTLGRNESRPGRLLDVRDYCKLHIVIHYVARFLGATASGSPFHVVPLGRVGSDPPGRQVLQEMSDTGIDTRFVEVVATSPTLFSVCFQYPDGTGGNITTSNSAAAEFSVADVDHARESLKTGGRDVIALAVPEVPLDVRRYFLQVATETGAFRAASFVSLEVRPALESGMFRFLDLVALNDAEAGELIGDSFSGVPSHAGVERCQAFLQDSCPELRMVVTTGKSGGYAITKDAWNYSPAPPVEVRSTAGAGDATLGGIIAALAAGVPFIEGNSDRANCAGTCTALDVGVLLGSYKCQSPHTIHPGASLDALESFAAQCGKPFDPRLRTCLGSGDSRQ